MTSGGEKRGCCICAIGKNENKYVREWAEHHKMLGVEKIFLIDNNDAEGENFRDAIGDYIDSGFVELIDYRGKVEYMLQYNAYKNLYRRIYDKTEFEWVAFVDLDEFLWVEGGKTIDEFLASPEFSEADQILLSWKIMTSTDIETLLHESDKPLKTRFQTEVEYDEVEVKSIVKTSVKPNRIQHIHVAAHGDGVSTKRSDGSAVDQETADKISIMHPCYANAYIRHYAWKSVEEFRERRINQKTSADQGANYEKIKSRAISDAISNFYTACICRILEADKPAFAKALAELAKEAGVKPKEKLDGKRHDARIFVFAHKTPGHEIKDNSLFTPLQVGAAITGEKICKERDDMSKDNISAENYMYRDITGTYYIWKRLAGNSAWKSLKYVGQTQYSRILPIDENEDFDKLLEKAGFVAVKASLPMSVKEQFGKCHRAEDLEECGEIVKSMYPDYGAAFDKVMNGKTLYCANGLVLKRDDYVKYAEFMFGVLKRFAENRGFADREKFEEHIKAIADSKAGELEPAFKSADYQRGILGFIGERLMTVFLVRNFDKEPDDLKYVEPTPITSRSREFLNTNYLK